MMTQIRWMTIVTLATFLLSPLAQATSQDPKNTGTLEDQLKALDQGNQAPSAVNREKLYAVQTRYLPLTHKSEITMGGAYNLTSDSFLRTEQFEVGYRFHFNDRWGVGINQAWVDNTFKSEVNNLKATDGAVPAVPYATTRTDVLLEYNVFYGKFRFSADTVSYFDQYVAVGPGIVAQNTGTVGAAVGDVGFAFWLSNWGSARVGLKEYYYNESYPSGKQMENNLHAHLDMGYLF